MKINLAGCVIIEDEAILLLHRIKNDWYELPGGKIDGNESAEEAAIREIKEELLCDVSIVRKIGEKDFSDDKYTMGYTWFLATLHADQTPAVGEPEKFDHYKFIPINQLQSTSLSTNMKSLLEELEAGRISF
jgi:8-oxo-dGTP diphosphatase